MLPSEKAYKVTYVSEHTCFPISHTLVAVGLIPTSASTLSGPLPREQSITNVQFRPNRLLPMAMGPSMSVRRMGRGKG
jgi:hypothetical protein